MPQILQSKNLATKFRMLVEIAGNQPNIQQKLIAEKVGVTPQAISDYISQLLSDGFISSGGRSQYKVTQEGVNWMIEMTRELKEYASYVEKAITNVAICAAVADVSISRGQLVGLKMKDGVLLATDKASEGARGTAISDADVGEDVGVSNIEGIVELTKGHIMILKVPGIEKGGSKKVDFDILKTQRMEGLMIGAIGLEALSVLKKIAIEPDCFYGVEAAIVEAARSGLSSVVVCVDDQVPNFIQRLENEKLEYSLLDISSDNK